MNKHQISLVDLKAQHAILAHEIKTAIMSVVERGDFVLGQAVWDLEEEFAAYCEAKFAIGVDSGTSALQLALEAVGVGPGDEVITTANTFMATIRAISCAGAIPVLVDIDHETYTMSIDSLKVAISERTRAIIPVHLYGQPADMQPIIDLAEENDLFIIEDACQAHGARYRGQRVGSLGHAAAFSFYPAKNLGAMGDGGIIVTNDEAVARKCRLLRNFGQENKNVHLIGGHNRRLDTIQASILRTKLKELDRWNSARREHAQLYHHLLADVPLIVPAIADYSEHVFHLYVIRITARDQLQDYLHQRGVSTGIHYPTPIHLQPAFLNLGYGRGDFPVAEQFADQILSLPMYPELTSSQIEVVCAHISEFSVEMGMDSSQSTLVYSDLIPESFTE